LKCSLEQAEAIVRLSALPEWRAFIGMVTEHSEILMKTLIMNENINADIKRGELRTVVGLADAIDGASDLIKAHQQPKK
jgi:hypothetical protein